MNGSSEGVPSPQGRSPACPPLPALRRRLAAHAGPASDRQARDGGGVEEAEEGVGGRAGCGGEGRGDGGGAEAQQRGDGGGRVTGGKWGWRGRRDGGRRGRRFEVVRRERHEGVAEWRKSDAGGEDGLGGEEVMDVDGGVDRGGRRPWCVFRLAWWAVGLVTMNEGLPWARTWCWQWIERLGMARK